MGASEDVFDQILDNAAVKFDSAEHADIPSECYLYMSANPKDDPVSGKSDAPINALHYVDGVYLSFAKIIALAGDFYSNVPESEPISYGKDIEERRKRFTTAVSSMKKGSRLSEMDKYLNTEVVGFEEIMTLGPGGENKPEDFDFNLLTEAYHKKTSKSDMQTHVNISSSSFLHTTFYPFFSP